MVSNRCKIAVKEALKSLGLHFVMVDLGEIDIMEDISLNQRNQLQKLLNVSGLELMDDKKAMLIEKIIFSYQFLQVVFGFCVLVFGIPMPKGQLFF